MEIKISLRPVAVNLALVALVFSLSGCASSSIDLTPTKSQAPVANPHPTELLRVFGTVASSFSIRIFTDTLSSAPKCRREINWLEGAYSPIEVWSEVTVHRTGDQYEAIIPIDQYKEGMCRWNLFSIDFYITDKNGVSSDSATTYGLGLPRNTGPIPFIWVNEPGKIDAYVDDPRFPGVQKLPTITERCGEAVFEVPLNNNAKTSDKHITCPYISPQIDPVINDEAKEVHLNIAKLRPHQR